MAGVTEESPTPAVLFGRNIPTDDRWFKYAYSCLFLPICDRVVLFYVDRVMRFRYNLW
ncbi:hypothetical protein QUA46_12170 [Microcoleus sp. MON2_D6]|uniref:hypothetical protein n=1 Tax=unclassified Microcoleus TaxID=2642155 RepID=UPI002FCE74AB